MCGAVSLSLTWKRALNEVFEQLQVTVLQLHLHVYLGQQCVAAAKLALQVLWTPQTFDLTTDHHCQPCTESLTLLHTGEQTLFTCLMFLNPLKMF